ncbi:hypothetical protein RRF57_010015 [Xylaria bambusicola]|uniref:Uncharacterized protein n=1 Tax=Xylaria bambusicola TaxID=326684 RepID=A0AAN7UXP0_9PEZI
MIDSFSLFGLEIVEFLDGSSAVALELKGTVSPIGIVRPEDIADIRTNTLSISHPGVVNFAA